MDKELRKLDFYKHHELMLPYIGENYLKCKILLVAESHYLSPEDRENFDMNKWLEDEKKVLITDKLYINTRDVIKGHSETESPKQTFFYRINQALKEIEIDKEYFWKSVSFMNYFIVPSTNGKAGIKNLTERIIEESQKNFEEVLEILKPNCIMFVSKKSYNLFMKYKSKKLKYKEIFCCQHPSCAWWFRKQKNGNRAREMFKEKIKTVLGEK